MHGVFNYSNIAAAISLKSSFHDLSWDDLTIIGCKS